MKSAVFAFIVGLSSIYVCEATVSCYVCEYTWDKGTSSGDTTCPDVASSSSATKSTSASCAYCKSETIDSTNLDYIKRSCESSCTAGPGTKTISSTLYDTVINCCDTTDCNKQVFIAAAMTTRLAGSALIAVLVAALYNMFQR